MWLTAARIYRVVDDKKVIDGGVIGVAVTDDSIIEAVAKDDVVTNNTVYCTNG